MSVRVRFAPSPTGVMHVGNIKAAVINWLFARTHGGAFVLRLDDTDAERSRAEFAEGTERDLRWLGLSWDSFHRQSDRLERYEAAARRLRELGRLYACYETAQELETKRRLQLARGRPPVYDRAGLALDEAGRRALEAAGRKPHWRFLLSPGRIAWDDLIRGQVTFEAEALSDPVLVREDGRPLYTLSSVVDDGELAISHVLRGEDHVANTAVQVQLFEALDHAVPRFGHFALLVGEDGEPLSKRLGGLAIAALREEGIEPLAILSMLARLGSADPVEARADHRALVDNFDVTRFGRAAARFDVAELWNLNAKVLHLLAFEAVSDRLPPGVTEMVWNAVRGNLTKLGDVAVWLDVINGPVEPVIEDPEFAAIARDAFPDKPVDGTTWPEWTAALKKMTGRKGRALFMPLRLALTGRADGPELRALLPLIGRRRILRRLAGERA